MGDKKCIYEEYGESLGAAHSADLSILEIQFLMAVATIQSSELNEEVIPITCYEVRDLVGGNPESLDKTMSRMRCLENYLDIKQTPDGARFKLSKHGWKTVNRFVKPLKEKEDEISTLTSILRAFRVRIDVAKKMIGNIDQLWLERSGGLAQAIIKNFKADTRMSALDFEDDPVVYYWKVSTAGFRIGEQENEIADKYQDGVYNQFLEKLIEDKPRC